MPSTEMTKITSATISLDKENEKLLKKRESELPNLLKSDLKNLTSELLGKPFHLESNIFQSFITLFCYAVYLPLRLSYFVSVSL